MAQDTGDNFDPDDSSYDVYVAELLKDLGVKDKDTAYGNSGDWEGTTTLMGRKIA